MIQIKDALKIRVTLVMKLNDFMTGKPVMGDNSLKVVSGNGLFKPVMKPDGYFVFTDHRPESVRIVSKMYNDVLISTQDHAGAVLRYSLIPRKLSGFCFPAAGEAYIGFGGKGIGYALAGTLTKDSMEIRLYKDDLFDITDLFHVLVSPDKETEVVYLTKNLGDGCYRLKTAPTREFQSRGTRLTALWRVAGGNIPVHRGADTVYVLSEGRLSVKSLEAELS